jgi:Effector-associated domain 1/Trypsin-like peptidase domain
MPRLMPRDSRLSGDQYSQFHEAVLDAYDDGGELRRVLLFRLGKRLNLIANPNDSFDDVVFTVITKADTEGWSANLLNALRATRPENGQLLAFAQGFGLATKTPGRSELELLIHEGDALLDVDAWRTELGAAEARVCRIEQKIGASTQALGTGFLLGPGVVMTNFHVMEEVINGSIAPDRIGLRFDYKVLAGSGVINAGRVYGLAADWDIDHSPYSHLDTQVDPIGTPSVEELDYALVRVDGKPGLDPVSTGQNVDPKAPQRGWIPVPDYVHDWKTRRALMILQHPAGDPLKLAMRMDASPMPLPDGNEPTRVRYTTRTEHGSSGSPCFDIDWNLIALHHSGDPKYAQFKVKPDWNEGVPFTAISRLLDKHGRAEQLGTRNQP